MSDQEVNRPKLQKLIDFLRKLEPKKFDFNRVWNPDENAEGGCGTCGCAIGWCPTVFPDEVSPPNVSKRVQNVTHIESGKRDYSEVAEALFNIEGYTAHNLFTPRRQDIVHPDLQYVSAAATPQRVADMLTQFLELVEQGEIKGHK